MSIKVSLPLGGASKDVRCELSFLSTDCFLLDVRVRVVVEDVGGEAGGREGVVVSNHVGWAGAVLDLERPLFDVDVVVGYCVRGEGEDEKDEDDGGSVSFRKRKWGRSGDFVLHILIKSVSSMGRA
jgi:hypothetical protein